MWQNIPADTLCWVLGVWLFAVGGCVGSFLNVVVYRLPRKMSLLRPPSHCPACARPIRWFDNVPIFGWLWLRGRCRDCRAAISARYPLVEAITAGLFLGLGLVEWLGGGTNLPPRTAMQPGGVYAYHLWLLCTLLTAALIEYDGYRPLRLLFTVAVLAGVHAPLVWPWLHPLPAFGAGEYVLPGAIDGTAGLAAGLLLGWLGSLLGRTQSYCVEDGRSETTSYKLWLLPAMCVGVYLGWQVTCAVVPAAVVAWLVLRLLSGPIPALRRIGPTAVLAVLTLAAILSWSHWASWLARA